MPITVVQHAVLEPFSPSSPQTLAFGSPVTAGNLIVAVAAFQGAGAAGATINTPTDAHDTFHPCTGASVSNAGTGTQMVMFYAAGAAGGATTVSSSFSGVTGIAYALYIFELSGVNTYDAGAGNSQSTNTAATTDNFTTNHAGIIVAATINANDATGPGTGYTQIELTVNYSDELEYMLSTAGTSVATAAMDGSTQNWGIVAGNFYFAAPNTVLPTDAVFFGMT